MAIKKKSEKKVEVQESLPKEKGGIVQKKKVLTAEGYKRRVGKSKNYSEK